jgi:hypothetical protein
MIKLTTRLQLTTHKNEERETETARDSGRSHFEACTGRHPLNWTWNITLTWPMLSCDFVLHDEYNIPIKTR